MNEYNKVYPAPKKIQKFDYDNHPWDQQIFIFFGPRPILPVYYRFFHHFLRIDILVQNITPKAERFSRSDDTAKPSRTAAAPTSSSSCWLKGQPALDYEFTFAVGFDSYNGLQGLNEVTFDKREIVASMLYEISVASWCCASINDHGSHAIGSGVVWISQCMADCIWCATAVTFWLGRSK